MKNIFLSQILALALSLLLSQQAYAKFTYEGRLTDLADNPISGPIYVKDSILSPSTGCIIYQETHPVTADLKGFFSIQVGGGAATAGLSIFDSVFKNDVSITGIGSCIYTPGLGDSRLMQIEISTDAGTTYEPLVGTIALGKAPQATHADTVGGLDATKLFRVAADATAAPALTLAELTKFNALIAGTSTQYVQNGGSNIVMATGAGSPTSPAYSFSGDTTTGMYWPGTNMLGFSVGGASGMKITKNGASSATLTVNGHIGSSGPVLDFTALSNCGLSGASISGDDTRGRVTLGNSSTTTCTITFATAFTAPPVCVVSWGAVVPPSINIGASATINSLAIHFSATPPLSSVVNYLCLQ